MKNPRIEVLRKLGKEIEEDQPWPRPHCPVCEDSYLAVDEPATEESATTRHLHGHEAFEPEWIDGTFSTVLTCESAMCGQRVMSVGTFRVGYSKQRGVGHPDDYDFLYSEFYRVEYFSPPLKLLLVPDDASDEVREAVHRAGKLLFAAPSAAATALRGAVEHFLSSQGVPAANARGRYLSLDERIRHWRGSKDADRVAELLLAVKWIGNEGTHGVGDLSVDEVLEGVAFIDEAFHATYVAPALDDRARAINAIRGRKKKS